MGVDIIAFNGANDVGLVTSLAMFSRWHHRCRSRMVSEIHIRWALLSFVRFVAEIAVFSFFFFLVRRFIWTPRTEYSTM